MVQDNKEVVVIIVNNPGPKDTFLVVLPTQISQKHFGVNINYSKHFRGEGAKASNIIKCYILGREWVQVIVTYVK